MSSMTAAKTATMNMMLHLTANWRAGSVIVSAAPLYHTFKTAVTAPLCRQSNRDIRFAAMARSCLTGDLSEAHQQRRQEGKDCSAEHQYKLGSCIGGGGPVISKVGQ
jgi:hypothetical protein